MAYTDDDFQVRVEGTLGASESFANTWTFQRTDPGADVDNLTGPLHDFYDFLATSYWTDRVTATNASWRALDGSSSGDGTWALITGSAAGVLIPTECALRVTIRSFDNRLGGPFLAGFRSADLSEEGTFDTSVTSDIADALVTMIGDLETGDWRVALDKPSSPERTDLASSLRVGGVFDVIRRRRNQLPEQYQLVPTGY
jgi:hypothetical protein